MANSLQRPNLFNGQYALPPPLPPQFFPAHNAHGNPQTPPVRSPFPQGVQHNPAFAATNGNGQRFEANSHVPSPPLPFQFPPNFDPDMLKRLAASNSLPFNANFPPPPPPLPHMFSSSFGPPPQNAFASAPSQPYTPGFHQSKAPFHPPTSTPLGKNTISAMGQEAHAAADTDLNLQGHQTNQQLQGANPIADGLPISSLDGSLLSRFSRQDGQAASTPNGYTAQRNRDDITQNGEAQAGTEEQLSQSYAQKHEQARATISEFVAAGITYQNLVDESVKVPVLDKLYAELGLNRYAQQQSSPTKPAQPVPAASAVSKEPLLRPSIESTSQKPSTPQPEVIDPNMERKDRIARMLAARKGQSVASAISSQSASPAPVESTLRLDTLAVTTKAQPAPTQAQALPVVDTLQTGIANKQANQPSTLSEPQSAEGATKSFNTLLPTPVREEIKRNGFSIPGLFMTSEQPEPAEPDFDGPSPPIATAHERIEAEYIDTPKSLKRSAEPFPTNILPQPKRQVSQTITDIETVDNVQSSSTPKLTETATSSPVTRAADSREQPGFADSDRVIESVVPGPKSKWNQNKLKDRMAALKADLLKKNSRKRALQDGMPVLNAEVEKTRELLQERQDRLSAVRIDIETKTAELAQARDEEGRLAHEIERLENQLTDGETGQQQFSTELHRLNDQIVADENESAAPPKIAIETSIPIPDIAMQLASPGRAVQQGSKTETMFPALEHSEHGEIEPLQTSYESQLRGGEAESYMLGLDQPHTETEYSAEQEDLDRQLNSENVSTTVHISEGSNVVDARNGDAMETEQQESPAKRSLEPSASTIYTPVEVTNSDESDDDRMSIDEASGEDSSGSASMSDSGSDEYDPNTQDEHTGKQMLETNDNYEPQDTTPYQQSTEAENDDYEPAEEVDVINVDTLDEIRREPEPDSSRPRTADRDGDGNSLFSSPTDRTLTSSAFPTRPGSATKEPLISAPSTEGELTQPQTGSDLIQHIVEVPALGAEQPAIPRFVPYQSPLSNLKSFRFHPQFNEHVKNGYRSLTYSNRIDPKKPLCPAELDGLICTDAECEEQHFGAIALTDDKILVQMSSANDFEKDQRDKYLLGLKKVIADLREQGVKEFSAVANALSKYRREYMAEQNGILP